MCRIVFNPLIYLYARADFPRDMKIGKRVEKQKERKVPMVLGG